MRFGEIDRVVSLSKDDFKFELVAFNRIENRVRSDRPEISASRLR